MAAPAAAAPAADAPVAPPTGGAPADDSYLMELFGASTLQRYPQLQDMLAGMNQELIADALVRPGPPSLA